MRFLGITFVAAALLAASAAFPQNHHSPKRAAKKHPRRQLKNRQRPSIQQ